jgi:hypothetical protein
MLGQPVKGWREAHRGQECESCRRSNHTEIPKLGSIQGIQQRLRVKLHCPEFFNAAPFDAHLPRIGLGAYCGQFSDQFAEENMLNLMEVRRQAAFWIEGGNTFSDEAKSPDTGSDTKFLSEFPLEGNWKPFAVRLTAARQSEPVSPLIPIVDHQEASATPDQCLRCCLNTGHRSPCSNLLAQPTAEQLT